MKDIPGGVMAQNPFHEGVEVLLRQGFDLWPEMLYGGPTGDEAVTALAALGFFHIADAVLELLLPVPELLQLLLALLPLFAEFLDFGVWLVHKV